MGLRHLPPAPHSCHEEDGASHRQEQREDEIPKRATAILGRWHHACRIGWAIPNGDVLSYRIVLMETEIGLCGDDVPALCGEAHPNLALCLVAGKDSSYRGLGADASDINLPVFVPIPGFLYEAENESDSKECHHEHDEPSYRPIWSLAG
jgi:hypothetical protein